MNCLEVIRPGLMSTLQDGGRQGLAFYAIPASGPMDCASAQLANLLVGNPLDATLIECNVTPPRLLFRQSTRIGLTGAEMRWQIDQQPAPLNRTLSVSAGSQLWGEPAARGMRGYVAIAGTIETTRSFGSSACYALAQLGGNGGRPLSAGDVVCWQTGGPDEIVIELRSAAVANDPIVIEAIYGPEFDSLLAESQLLLTDRDFSVTSQSNRMGARLHGPMLETSRGLLDSLPVLPGMIQLLPSGQCIVVLRDGQTTGGYPRIAYLPGRSLDKFSQLRFQQPFRIAVN